MARECRMCIDGLHAFPDDLCRGSDAVAHMERSHGSETACDGFLGHRFS